MMATPNTTGAMAQPQPLDKSDLRHQIFEGQLNKFTNVMKGWQYRWFVVRPETGTLEYYLMEDTTSALAPFSPSKDTSGGSGGGLRVSAKCRGSQHLAGCIVVPSDEDCLTFSAIFASQETYKLRASNVKERQVWVDRLRAVAQLHEKAIAHTHPPPLTLSPPPPPPGSKSQLTVHGEPTEALQNLSLSVLEAFGSVHDILHQADLRHTELRAAVEQLPMQGPKPNCLDDDLLTIKATSQAALISMQEALGMLQEIVEGTNASQQAPQAPARQRKSSHKFLRPLSPHRKGSRSSKGSKKGEASGSPMVVTAANSSRQSINSSASCQAADPDQVSVASETSSSFHDSLAS